MKTKLFNLVIIVSFSMGLIFNGYSQTTGSALTAEDIQAFQELDLSDINPKQYIGVSAGFGWNSSFGNDETTICFGADYLRKLNKKEDCGAYYGGFGNYHNSSQDDFKRSIFKVGIKAEYHYPITRSKETQLIGGLNGFYKFGNQENFGFDEDITGYGGELYTGVNIRLNHKLDIGLVLPVFKYTSVTFDNGSNENTEDFTSFALNKRNPAMAYARFRVGGKNKK